MTNQERGFPLVFIDDAHTFGGTQVALAWTIRIVISHTTFPVLCLCTAHTRAAIEAIVGPHTRLEFVEVPAALPLNIFTFAVRLPYYWLMIRRIRRAGVKAWWLNQADIEFCLAPLLVLRALGEEVQTYLHGTSHFSFFYRSASVRRRLLSSLRDAVADRFAFRLHSLILVPSRASLAEIEMRMPKRNPPQLAYLYPPSGRQGSVLKSPAPPAGKSEPLQIWMIGNVVQGHKNQRAALDVLDHFTRHGCPATLTLAGIGPDLQSFKDEALRRGLSDRIQYLGWVTDPCALVPRQAVVFIPSFHETMSLVAQEAMRYGLRLVVSPIAVFHEWLPAPLVAADFSTEAFAARILELHDKSAESLLTLYQRTLGQFSDELFLEKLLRFTNCRAAPYQP